MNMYEIERYVNVGLRKSGVTNLFSKEQKDVTSAATSSAGGIIDVKKYLDVIGYPPESLLPDTNKVIRNSMPVAALTPCVPSQMASMRYILSESDGKREYENLLSRLNFRYDPPIKIAFLADTFPTDTFNNEYGQSFMHKMADIGAQGLRELMMMSGHRDAGDFVKSVAGKIPGDAVTEALEKVGGALGHGVEQVEGATGKDLSGIIKTARSLLAGGRVDFPQIWTGSSYSPSYSLTVRLYNPNPADPESTRKYIIGPLAVLLTLGLPISIDTNTYNWPLFIRVNCPGIFKLESGYLASIAVVKGGDQQQIAHNQRLSIVDVRLEIGSLYSTILTSAEQSEIDRPSLEKYLDNLGHVDENIKKTENYNASSGKATGLLGLAETYLGDLADIPGRFYEGIKTGNVDLLTPPMSRVSNANNSAFTNLKGAGRGMEFF